MKKIGIITIPDYNNYGNRLQNYAIKTFFEKKGFYVNTLEMNDESFPKKKIRGIKLFLKKWKLFFAIHVFELLDGKVKGLKRYLKFETFSKKYLNNRYIPSWNMEKCKKIGKEYDYIVLGSDQIWHPYVNKTPNLFFGLFVEPNKRVYFAPSFGVEQLTNEYSEIVKKNIQGVKKLSIRENAGKNILAKLTSNEVAVLSDPTLLLTDKEWEVISKKPKNIPNEYILSCFLGPLNEKYINAKKEIEECLKFETYSIADKNNNDAFQTGPSEFVYAIKNAKFIITDSFHAVVFAIIFNKPFLVFSRLKEDLEKAGLDSRIDDLLEKFSLQNRKFNQDINIDDLLTNIDSKEVLESQRKIVENYFDDIN